MLDALPRRAVLGQLAALPFVSTAGAMVVARPAQAEHAAIIARIDVSARRCADTKEAFENALAAYQASFPQPHWSIDYDNRARALCACWVHSSVWFPGGPRFVTNKECLARDYHHLWTVHREDPDAIRTYARLKRRLEARVRRHEARVASHIERHRLEELHAACSVAERDMHELAQAVFGQPASTLPEILVQARMLQAFGATLGGRQDWAAHQAGMFGRQMADSICKLEAA